MRIKESQYNKADVWVFMILTALSLWNGKLTVFYLMYLFWWDEFVRKLVGFIYYQKRKNKEQKILLADVFGSFFLLGIYWVFIIVIFMMIANWGNNGLFYLNFRVFLFKNWFFNINIIWFFIENIALHQSNKEIEFEQGAFTSSAIVLHISIILGAFMMFLVVKPMVTFTPDNYWGSLLIALPFLLLKLVFKTNIFRKN